MSRIVGVKTVICTCGKEMVRTGGVFGPDLFMDSYLCLNCPKVVNVITLSEDEAERMIENRKGI